MFVNNLFFNNNQCKINSTLKNKNSSKLVYFTGNPSLLTREIKLNPEEMKKVSFIAEAYDKILSVFSSFNGIYQKKFKSLYPKLAAGEKIKGFVFNSVMGINDKKLQIVRFNSKLNSDELLTFGILDSQNQNLLRYRINKDGKVRITSDKDSLSKLSINPFSQNKNIKYTDYLNRLVEEMKNFSFYSENFKIINRKVNPGNTERVVMESFFKVKALQKSQGIKSEIEEMSQNYAILADVLNINRGKDALELKQAFFGADFGGKTKGLVFKNLLENGKTYGFCPLQSKDDDRLFKVVIQGKNGDIENAFVFFSDGKVAKLKRLSSDTNAFRPNNLEYISDTEIEKLGIKEIFARLNQKFLDFKEFIFKSREAKLKKKMQPNKQKIRKLFEESLESHKHHVEDLAKQKAQETLRLKDEKLAKEQERKNALELKKQKAAESAKHRAEESARKKAEKLIQKQERVKAKELKLQQRQEAARKKSEEKRIALKNTLVNNIEVPIEKPEQATIQKIRFPSYQELRLWKIREHLDKLFNTPVEQRSSHLVHERLLNGKIFAGRVSLKASDGADIVVSRVKSPKYVDFTYYSVSVKKDKKEFVLNIDPAADKILISKDGKPVINAKSMVSYTTKEEFLKQNPEAINLSKYLTEIFEIRTDEPRKVVQTSFKVKKQVTLLKQKEQDVINALYNKIEEVLED